MTEVTIAASAISVNCLSCILAVLQSVVGWFDVIRLMASSLGDY